MSSASNAELEALFVTTKEMVPMHHTIKGIGWPQQCLLIHTDNSTTAGVVNKEIVPCKLKAINSHFYWLCYHNTQCQFWFYWAYASLNWGNYSTKYHPSIYNEANFPSLWDTHQIIDSSSEPIFGNSKGTLIPVPGGTHTQIHGLVLPGTITCHDHGNNLLSNTVVARFSRG